MNNKMCTDCKDTVNVCINILHLVSVHKEKAYFSFCTYNMSAVHVLQGYFMFQRVFRMLYLSALLYIKKRLTLYYVCNTCIMAFLPYTHTEKAYFNRKNTNIDTKALL